ncbi:hypothetical protein [Nocardia niwae]|uniref:hypothetical protein n=1 Tax=Nocardia niwae TaxID=626084 RepID=UPI003402E7B4
MRSTAEVVLEHATLYHGSATSGITEFERAEYDTVGAGVYLANEPTARAYALRRSVRSGEAVLYTVEVDHARLIDLTDQHTVAEIIAGFRPVLQAEHHRVSRNGGAWFWIGALEQMIAEIDSGRGGQVARVKHVTQRSGELFSGYLSGLGYSGCFALEGGEGQVPEHHTYLLFDPAHLRITSEQHLIEATTPDRSQPGSRTLIEQGTKALVEPETQAESGGPQSRRGGLIEVSFARGAVPDWSLADECITTDSAITIAAEDSGL